MQAVLLAAGKSSRFEPFSEKSLITIAGKTILEHTIISLKKVKVTDIVIVISENSEIPEVIGDGERVGIKISYVIHDGARGMGAALLDAKERLEESFFLLGPYHAEVHEFIKDMLSLQKDTKTVVLLSKKPTRIGYGFLKTENGKVREIIEKPEKLDQTLEQIVAVYLLNKTFLMTLEGISPSHYNFEAALTSYAESGNVTHLLTNKKTLTLKYAWDLLDIKDYILSKLPHHISKKAKIEKDVTIVGDVYVDEDAEIFEKATLKGPLYIGRGAKVGGYALLRNGCSVEENAVVGARMEMKNTLLLEHATTHSGFIGDSVIGRDTKIAGNFCTANVRLDRGPIPIVVKGEKVDSQKKSLGVFLGSSVNIGASVTTMPGTIIGERVIVGPSTTIMKNIPKDVTFYTKFSETIEKHHE